MAHGPQMPPVADLLPLQTARLTRPAQAGLEYAAITSAPVARREQIGELAWYKPLFECPSEGFMITDLWGYIANANHALCDLLGIDRESLLGLHLGLIFPQVWNPALFERWLSGAADATAKAESLGQINLRLQPRGKSSFYLSVRIARAPHPHTGSQVLLWLVTLTNGSFLVQAPGGSL